MKEFSAKLKEITFQYTFDLWKSLLIFEEFSNNTSSCSEKADCSESGLCLTVTILALYEFSALCIKHCFEWYFFLNIIYSIRLMMKSIFYRLLLIIGVGNVIMSLGLAFTAVWIFGRYGDEEFIQHSLPMRYFPTLLTINIIFIHCNTSLIIIGLLKLRFTLFTDSLSRNDRTMYKIFIFFESKNT